jgi:deoxycytidylate deaminase
LANAARRHRQVDALQMEAAAAFAKRPAQRSAAIGAAVV